MRLSKQHKVYGAVLGLALAALGADRIFSSAPAEGSDAAAEVAVVAESVKPAAKRVAAAAKATDNAASTDRRAISARLDDLAQTAGLDVTAVRDAFTPSTAWVPATAVTSVNAGDERARRFAADHKLTAVMGGKNAVAIIDGKPVRPGQTLDGFKLVTVSARDSKATFERAGGIGRLELRLPEGAVAQAN